MLRQRGRTVREYNLEFNSLARYAPAHVSNMSDRIHRYIVGLDSYYADSCLVMATQPGMDIAHIQAHAQVWRVVAEGVKGRGQMTGVRPKGLGLPVQLQIFRVDSFSDSSRVVLFLGQRRVPLLRLRAGDQ